MQDLKAVLSKLSGQVWLAQASTSTSSPAISSSNTQAGVVPFGVAEIDSALPCGGLSFGKLHEWFSAGHPACSILCVLATQALIAKRGSHFVLWIGKAVWPLPQFLLNKFSAETSTDNHLLLKQSIFVDPQNNKEILWASETALRSKQIAAIVSFCPRLSLQHSRRLSLAAQKNGSLALIVRPYQDRLKLSAAASRWLTTPTPTQSDYPVQRLELLALKGPKAKTTEWQIEVQHDENNTLSTIRLRVLPFLDNRSDTAQTSKQKHAA